MKIILSILLLGAAYGAAVAHTYTQGLSPYDWSYGSLNYRDEGTVNVNILYTTNFLGTWTDWNLDGNENDGWENSFDSWYDSEINQLFLQFEIPSVSNDGTHTDGVNKEIRCLVCMNVDENSELRDGDTGFAACYDNEVGNAWTYSATAPQYTLQTEDPKFTFMGTVKAVNGGTAVKATKKNGWLSTMTPWNKHKDTVAVECGDVNYAGDLYYMYPYHDSNLDDTDYIGIVSEEGFKNTGLNNGENHLKCWFRAAGLGYFWQSSKYDKDWTPDFEADDGQSIAGWASTGTAQIVHLKDMHKRIPYNVYCWDF